MRIPRRRRFGLSSNTAGAAIAEGFGHAPITSREKFRILDDVSGLAKPSALSQPPRVGEGSPAPLRGRPCLQSAYHSRIGKAVPIFVPWIGKGGNCASGCSPSYVLLSRVDRQDFREDRPLGRIRMEIAGFPSLERRGRNGEASREIFYGEAGPFPRNPVETS